MLTPIISYAIIFPCNFSRSVLVLLMYVFLGHRYNFHLKKFNCLDKLNLRKYTRHLPLRNSATRKDFNLGVRRGVFCCVVYFTDREKKAQVCLCNISRWTGVILHFLASRRETNKTSGITKSSTTSHSPLIKLKRNAISVRTKTIAS